MLMWRHEDVDGFRVDVARHRAMCSDLAMAQEVHDVIVTVVSVTHFGPSLDATGILGTALSQVNAGTGRAAAA